MMSEKLDIEIELGDNGAGEHCDDQVMRYGGAAALGGALTVLVCYN